MTGRGGGGGGGGGRRVLLPPMYVCHDLLPSALSLFWGGRRMPDTRANSRAVI